MSFELLPKLLISSTSTNDNFKKIKLMKEKQKNLSTITFKLQF